MIFRDTYTQSFSKWLHRNACWFSFTLFPSPLSVLSDYCQRAASIIQKTKPGAVTFYLRKNVRTESAEKSRKIKRYRLFLWICTSRGNIRVTRGGLNEARKEAPFLSRVRDLLAFRSLCPSTVRGVSLYHFEYWWFKKNQSNDNLILDDLFLCHSYVQIKQTFIVKLSRRSNRNDGSPQGDAIDYRWECGRFPMSTSFLTVSNPESLSSSETGVDPGIRNWKSTYLS
jgi:hypothetical protein